MLFLAKIDNDKKKEKRKVFRKSDKNAPKKTFFLKKCPKEYRFQDFSAEKIFDSQNGPKTFFLLFLEKIDNDKKGFFEKTLTKEF